MGQGHNRPLTPASAVGAAAAAGAAFAATANDVFLVVGLAVAGGLLFWAYAQAARARDGAPAALPGVKPSLTRAFIVLLGGPTLLFFTAGAVGLLLGGLLAQAFPLWAIPLRLLVVPGEEGAPDFTVLWGLWWTASAVVWAALGCLASNRFDEPGRVQGPESRLLTAGKLAVITPAAAWAAFGFCSHRFHPPEHTPHPRQLHALLVGGVGLVSAAAAGFASFLALLWGLAEVLTQRLAGGVSRAARPLASLRRGRPAPAGSFDCCYCYESIPYTAAEAGQRVRCPSCGLASPAPGGDGAGEEAVWDGSLVGWGPVAAPGEPAEGSAGGESPGEADAEAEDVPAVPSQLAPRLALYRRASASKEQRWAAVFDLANADLRRGVRLLLAALVYLGGLAAAVAVLWLWGELYKAQGRTPDKATQNYMGISFASVLLMAHGLARRVTARRAREWARRHGGRPPVLLLRAFSDDQARVGDKTYLVPALSRPVTLEEIVAEQFAAFGPVLAVGKPGQFLPPVGAGRLWLKDERWQKGVHILLEECQYVVMVLGRAHGQDGLAWEIEQIKDLDLLSKLVLVVPPVSEEEAEARWGRYNELLDGRLPPYEPYTCFAGPGPGGVWSLVPSAGRRRELDDYRGKVQLLVPTEAGPNRVAGEACVFCLRPVASASDGSFCTKCGLPAHAACVQPDVPEGVANCPACGAAPL